MKIFVCFLVLAFVLCVAGSVMAAEYNGFYDEQYEMTADGSGINGTSLLAGPDGSGFTFSGGVGTFLDNSTTVSQGLYTPGSLLIGSSSYIVDMRLKVLAANEPYPAGTSMSFKSNGVGRGVNLDIGGVSFVSSGVKGTESGYDFSNWTTARVVMTSGSMDFYAWNGTGWTSLAHNTDMGGTGVAASLGSMTQGFFLGSCSAGTTTLSNFQLDWVRVAGGVSNYQGVFLDKTAVPTPEPGSLLALASGMIGMAGFAIRRRRA
jgi:hypothetical protein